MSKTLAAAALGAALAFGVAVGAPLADNAPAAAAKFSVDSTTIEAILASPAATAVVVKYVPELPTTPFLPQIKDLSLRGLSAYPQANLNDEKLKAIQVEFDKIG